MIETVGPSGAGGSAQHEPVSAGKAAGSDTASPWSPFGSRVFAWLWLAMLVGNIGTWIRDVGSGWLMTTLSASATAVALVQVATTLPIFLLSLPAGALADIVNRRRMMLVLNVAGAGVLLALAVLTQQGQMTPTLLVLGLLAAGITTALMAPVQQSLTPLMVPRPLLRPAVALNSLGVNVARAIGPAVGGVLVAQYGAALNFLIDAMSYLIVIAAFWWWKAAAQPAASGPSERLMPALRVGLRFALHAPALQRVLLRAGSYFLFASAYWALLPLVARQGLGGGPRLYGLMLACVGIGAVAGALALPWLRRRWSAEVTLRAGTAATVAVLLVLGLVHDPLAGAAVMALAGAAWVWVLTTANVAAQTLLPAWVRGRGLALYLTVFYGAMTAGSLLWGQVADHTNLRTALLAAAVAGMAALLLAWRRPLPTGDAAEPDLNPANAWPEPVLSPTMAASLSTDRGPVMVRVTYRIDPAQRGPFLRALHALSAERLRDGAFDWQVYEDAADPSRFDEIFLLPSWQEHERQHARVANADLALQAAVHAFHLDGQAPRVRHGLAV